MGNPANVLFPYELRLGFSSNRADFIILDRSTHDRLLIPSLIDSGYYHPYTFESFPMGQGEADGALLRRRPGGPVQGGPCHQSLRETKKRSKGNDPCRVCSSCCAMPSTFTHIHLDAMASRACVKIFFTLVVLTRSLPGKAYS